MGYIEKGRAKTVTKVILWLVVISFIATIFVQWGMQRGGFNFTNSPFAVDGESISIQQLLLNQNFYAFMRERLTMAAAPYEMLAWSSIVTKVGQQVSMPLLAAMDSANENSEALAPVIVTMVGEQVLAREAEKAGFKISDKEVGALLARVFVDENGNFIGQENVERNLAMYGVASDNEKKFRNLIKRHLLVRRYTTSLFAAVQPAFQNQLQDFYKAQNQKVDFQLVNFPASRYLAEVEAPEDQVRNYFDENLDDFVKAEMLVFDSTIYSSTLEVTEGEIEAFYETNKEADFSEPEKRSINRILISLDEEVDEDALQAAQERAGEILEQLQEPGIAFETVMNRAAEQEGVSAEQMQGLTRSGDYDPRFIAAVFELEEEEQFSQVPVRTGQGIEIIQLTEIVGGPAMPLDEVRDEIIAMIRDERGPEESRIKADELRSRAASEDWQSLADEANYISFRPDMAAVEGDTTIYNLELGGNASGDVRNLESLFSVEAGQLSNVLDYGSNFAIFRVTGKGDALSSDFADFQPVAKLRFRKEKSEELAEARANEFANSLSGVNSIEAFESLAGELSLTPEVASTSILQEAQFELYGIDAPYGTDLVKEAIASGSGTVMGPLDRETGSVVLFVTNVTEVSEEGFESQRDSLAQNLLASWSYGQDFSGVTEQDALMPLDALLSSAVDSSRFSVDSKVARSMFGPVSQ